MELLDKFEILERLDNLGMSIEEFTTYTGQSAEHLRKRLTGKETFGYRTNAIIDYYLRDLCGEEVSLEIGDDATPEDIKYSRTVQTISIKEMAKELGISVHSYIDKIEKTDEEIPKDLLRMIQNVLNVPVKKKKKNTRVESKKEPVYGQWGKRGKIIFKIPWHLM